MQVSAGRDRCSAFPATVIQTARRSFPPIKRERRCRSYKLARRGDEVLAPPPPREVQIATSLN